MARIYPMGLLFSAILTLTVTGMIYNNYTASGLAPTFGLTCPGYPDVTCQNSNPSGCQAQPSQCTLSGTSIQLLNQQSPFTSLIHGDVTGALPYLTGNVNGFQPSKSMWQVTPFGSSNLYDGQCFLKYSPNATGLSGYQTSLCWQTSSLGVVSGNTGVIPITRAFKLPPVPGSANQTVVPFFGLGVTNSTTYPVGSSYIQSTSCKSMIGFFFEGTNTNTLAGCQYYYVHAGESTTYYYYAIDYNTTSAAYTVPVQGATRSISYCDANAGLNFTQCPNVYAPVVVQPENWDVFDCDQMINFPQGSTFHEDLGTGGLHIYNPLAVGSITPQCQAIVQAISNFKANANASGILGSVFLWLASIIIFIIATGINFQATGSIFGSGVGVAAGVNRQGTKFAQVMGLALVIFIPLYSEFGTWFQSGVLPNGLDGGTGLIGFVIGAMVFTGIVWQATQD